MSKFTEHARSDTRYTVTINTVWKRKVHRFSFRRIATLRDDRRLIVFRIGWLPNDAAVQ